MSKNLYSIKFVDANLKDSAQGLVLNITSTIDGNQISVAVSHAKTAFKIVPGETHHLLLNSLSSKSDSGRIYYLEVDKSANLKNLTFDMKFHSKSSLTYSLQNSKKTLQDDDLQIVPLETTFDTGNGLTLLHADLGIEGGHYMLKIKNAQENEAASVSFRFSMNNQLELEENGMTTGTLEPGEAKIYELMITKPADLELNLKTCEFPEVFVFLSPSSFATGKGNSLKPILTSSLMDPSSTIGTTYSDFFSKSTVVYLRVENRGNQKAEFTLISNTLGFKGAARDFFVLLPTSKVTPVPDETSLLVEEFGPAIDQRALKALYPLMTEIKITLSTQVFIGDYMSVHDLLKGYNKYTYCSALNGTQSDYFNGSVTYRVGANELIKSQEIKNIPVKLNPNALSRVNLRDLNMLLNTAGMVLAKAKIDIFEDNNFDPVATFMKFSNSTILQLGTVATAVASSDSNQDFISNMTKALLLLVTLLIMLAILLVFYLCANKLSGGYKQMANMEVDQSANLSAGKALEMVDAPPKTHDETTDVQRESSETI